ILVARSLAVPKVKQCISVFSANRDKLFKIRLNADFRGFKKSISYEMKHESTQSFLHLEDN
ncbi:MAG: hypothetical protein ACKVT2_16695, partial [Saprospiraceae bacterium]